MLMKSHTLLKWQNLCGVASFLSTVRNLTKTYKMYFQSRFFLILTEGPVKVPIHESHLPFYGHFSMLPFLFLHTGIHQIKILLKIERRDCNHR